MNVHIKYMYMKDVAIDHEKYRKIIGNCKNYMIKSFIVVYVVRRKQVNTFL